MSATQISKVVRQVHGALARHFTVGLTEAELWERYVHHRDEAAFEALVRRHGPMVLGVCRRILRNEQDAEDAFQATFLVLVRRAASLRSPRALANWLHGVARRTALEARRAAAKRRLKEGALQQRITLAEAPHDDFRPLLDHELGQLAEKYRIAVVLCDLEGKTRKEAARQLGWAEGTVASRLARGRGLLAKRLARRGFAGALMAAALSQEAAPACVPPALVVSTIKTGCGAAIGAPAQGLLSGTVAALTEGVLKSMLLSKVKSALVVVLIIAFVGLSAGTWISRSRATEQEQAAADGQEKPRRADLHHRVGELKQQLGQLQKEIARLEQKTRPEPAESETCDTTFLAKRFKYRVPFEIGLTETKEGGRIKIREVWGTRPRIEVGGQYLVRGTYTLPPGERGKLYFYATAGGAWGQTASLDLQSVELDKEKGEFALIHGMAGPGCFHLYLASPERYSQMFANVYFGTGDNVLRPKP
jgi:RNA polymerase sigma factor (sigma-70 family)